MVSTAPETRYADQRHLPLYPTRFSLSKKMSRLTRDGTAEPVSRDQILRHARGQGNIHFPCSADHEQDWQPYPVDPYSAICDDHTYIHTYIPLQAHNDGNDGTCKTARGLPKDGSTNEAALSKWASPRISLALTRKMLPSQDPPFAMPPGYSTLLQPSMVVLGRAGVHNQADFDTSGRVHHWR